MESVSQAQANDAIGQGPKREVSTIDIDEE